MYSTALCLPVCQKHPLGKTPYPRVLLDVTKRSLSQSKVREFLHLECGWQKVIGKVVGQNYGRIKGTDVFKATAPFAAI